MGDFISPNRRDVLDRIRRRFEAYRRHQGRSLSRADPYSQREFEQQRQETALLRQRWLESKTRRASKASKRNDSSGSVGVGSGPAGAPGGLPQVPGNPPVKHPKLDPAESATCERDLYNFEKSESQVPGGAGSAAGCPPDPNAQGPAAQGISSKVQSSVSVDINVHQGQARQIKVTVNTHTDQNSVNTPHQSTINTSSTTSATIHTSSDFCKKEPLEDAGSIEHPQNPVSNSSQNSFPDSFGLDDVEEILIAIEKEGGADLLKGIDLELGDPENSLSSPDMVKDESDLCSANQVSKDNLDNSKKKGSSEGVMFAEAVYDTHSAPQQGFPNAGAAPPVPIGYSRPPSTASNSVGAAPTGPPLLSGETTGPAAEALKQMAAHRQSQEQTNQYDMKGGQVMPPPYNAESYQDQYARRMGTPNVSYPSQYQNANYSMGGAGPYQYAQQSGNSVAGSIGPSKPDYGATKPLTHFSDPSGNVGTSSSLQQLQNQVQSHFSQAPQGSAHPGPSPGPGGPGAGQSHIQITQQQHLQMSHSGVPHMQVSQTQQMNIQAQSAPHVSVAQHQSFHMSTGSTAADGGTQQSSQHYPVQQIYREKMQQQAQQPTQGHPPQQHRPAEHAMDAHDPMSYTNRPPPEYKMPSTPHQNYPNTNMRQQNPLQTMQNMVNQTNQSMAGGGMYMKTEMEGVSHCQQLTGPNRTASPMTAVPSSQTPSSSYMQQPVPNGTVANRPTKSPAPTYTSAIMRGQRPPNVNVGPEGLNISQRTEWTRMVGPSQIGMMQHGQPVGPTGGHMGHRAPHMGSMMHYNNRYPSQMPAGSSMQGSHMQMTHHHHQQQQQQHGMQRGPIAPHMAGHSRTPGTLHHMRMSQHQIAMAQGQQGGHSMSGMTVTQTASMATTTNQHPHQPPPHPQAQVYPQHHPDPNGTRNGGTEFPALDFLDSGPGGNPDFFDSVSGPSDFNFIDDILGNK